MQMQTRGESNRSRRQAKVLILQTGVMFSNSICVMIFLSDQTSLKGRAIRKETAGPSNIETLDCPGGSSSSSSSSSSDDEHMPYPADEQMNDTLVTVTSRSLLAFKSTLNKVKQTVGQLQEYIRHAEEQLHVLEESGKGKKRSAPSEQNDLSNESIGTTKRKRKGMHFISKVGNVRSIRYFISV